MKIVLCGSYGDMDRFLEILQICKQKYGVDNVFPDDEHLKQSEPCIEAHHRDKPETNKTISIRAQLMRKYFEYIDKSDLVLIMNEKKEMNIMESGPL